MSQYSAVRFFRARRADMRAQLLVMFGKHGTVDVLWPDDAPYREMVYFDGRVGLVRCILVESNNNKHPGTTALVCSPWRKMMWEHAPCFFPETQSESEILAYLKTELEPILRSPKPRGWLGWLRFWRK